MNMARSLENMSLKLPIAVAALVMELFLADQARGQSALDGFDPNANGITIRVIVVQPDGKILIGGDFTSVQGVARNNIARLNPDGTLDTAFNPSADYSVRSIAVQADGKILVGGNFTSIGGQTRLRLARLDGTTGLADSFNPQPDNAVYAIAVQTDGKILATGDFTSIGGQTRNHIARLDPLTGLPDSFDPNANSNVYALAVQPDGKILVGGPFHGANSIGGQTRNYIARLDATTGLADSFDPNANDQPGSIAVQADGKILAGGLFTNIGGQPRNHIARLDPMTGAADSFDPSANNYVATIAVQADGKILAGGAFNGTNSIGGQMRNRIARLDPVTGLADSFDPNPNDRVLSIAVQADGKVLVGGDFSFFPPNGTKSTTRNHIARLETDGRLDQTIGDVVPGASQVLATAMQPDGKILIGGGFTTVSSTPRNHIARLNVDGTLDTAFDPNVTGINNFPFVTSIAVQADGKILVGGFFNNIGGQPRNNIARLDPVTGQADSFDPSATGGNASVRSVVVQADGKILVGGQFSSIGGQSRNNIARLDPATGLADSFDPNATGGSGEIESIAVQADGKILVGGYFTSIGGKPRNHIARLDPTTGLADSFDPNAIGAVWAIAVQADGKILVGGIFGATNSIGGQSRNRIARLDPTTGLADSFNPNADGSVVFAIALQADGKILVGGDFNSIGGKPRTRVARLDPAGVADSFDSHTAGTVNSIALQTDGKILIGGSLSSVGGICGPGPGGCIQGQTRGSFARLSNDTTALQNLVVTPKTITWTRSGSSQRLVRATFEYSTDNVNYTPLGNGIPQSGSSTWTLPGLNLPIGENFYIRARGHYRSGQENGSESITESVRNVFLIPTFGNISSRGRVETGDNAMIGGFIITGTQPKTVIVRGIGPSLNMPGALADPIIEVHGSSGELLATNDNWKEATTKQQIIDSGLAPKNDLESALWGIINPGSYTVVLRDKNGSAGIGVFEAYDLDQAADSQLANVSTRGFVQTGDNILIGGVIVLGQSSRRVIVRAIGPSLAVTGRLEDPILELYDGNGGLIAANDNWRTDQEAEIIATSIPPSNDLESAIVRNLAPGNYTAVVRGAKNTTGIAVVEAYALE
jgi:uncharacterized delta-60 repeat protein